MRQYTFSLLLLLSPSLAFAQNDAKVPDPDPELERKTFTVAPGFEVSLFAADPLLAKPIQMNFDPQGRLWIASSEIYPQIKPGEKANDKIIVLEDTNGDGKADKTTVFADGLLIPTGLEPGDGGVYVANSTELVHLSASKPGGKADKRKVLLSGFGTEDTHHIIHTFRWGPDCRLYFNQSIYIHSHIETPSGVKRLNAGGIWRYNPDKTELDVFARGWVNTWGHAFDKYGQSLATDGAGGEGINHAIPGGYYLTSVGPHAQRLLHGMNPGSPKYCGLEVISGRHFPDDWQGDVVTNDFRGHRVCRFKLQDDGSTFAAREMTEVVKSNHPAFRPIDVKMGPDGALYIADWYNPIIQHGEVDFRDPRRDHTHGRIWRVTAKGRDLVKKPKLVDATIPELLEQLKAPEQWTRQQAKRVLKERGAEKVLPELEKWIDDLAKKDEMAHLEAMWVRIALGERAGGETSYFRDPRAKAIAVRGYTYGLNTPKPTDEIFAMAWAADQKFITSELQFATVQYDNPRARLEGVRALSLLKSAEAAEAALRVLDFPMDRTLDYALWLTLRELEPYWLPEFKSGKLTFGGDAKKLAFALNAIGNKDTVKPVLALIDSGKVPKENVHGLYLLLAQIGGSEELGKVFAHADRDTGVSADQRNALFLALEDAVRTRKVAAPKNADQLHAVIDEINTQPDSKTRPASRSALRLAGLWKVGGLRPALESIAKSEKAIDPVDRAAALEGLALFGDANAKTFITKLSGAEQKPDVRRLALVALAALDTPVAATETAKFLPDAKPDEALIDLFAAFVNRRGGASVLAKALADKKLPADVAKIGLKAVRAAGQPADDLTAALTKAGDLTAARKPPTEAEVKALAADALKTGDAARGEAVYRRKELQCLACHAYGGAGGQVGPDLTSIGASAQADYVVDSLLLPHKAIKEGFDVTRVVTTEDQVVQGIKVREGNGVLVLRTAEDKEITIPVKDIAERTKSTKSLMPEGLTDQLTKQDFTDLVRYISELGKVGGAYAPSKARVVRRWQVIEPTNANLNAFRRARVSAAAEAESPFSWAPAYSKVSGDLPLAEQPKFTVWNDTAPQTVLRFQLDVTTAGAAKLKFNSVAGLTVYVGNTPIEPKPETVLDLKAGVQTVTILIDRSKRATEDVRIELDDVEKSPARVAVVGGK
ncbi:membrane-bound dehydrogenase domain protein : Membrane-bound dehydrogenase domain protein OS=Pirellula staleyi (strain ATCC 27377 / DSM 6068 / ICPB 4128) GN=Psta_2212 PE=4 SV=1: Cytochrom_C [Gemmata massiliana]|uniref:Cytochrome c domain-containing protein n=1 Tax=Gemmata massiliana TaxID=1210884 RepID=A0A6P2D4E9_9BACT|nr:PVC-type heme-binding CxxCH protein [Gemmata massiliana]VTR96009.1 membrane-bound dehydrogenase domain protein : Membrane-bound dehydrogenase domain protein OS=Pirellula staleyi (strain ATCC 27377 / DSM 6068 / ICPB 4128) GN=Psta_2212 PE=4 SV=1: Cytochrom_C [Gemmata massiliana]